MRNLGIIAFANQSGLGYQTKRLVELIKPERVIVIDSSPFSKNTKQNFHWYQNFNGYKIKGFPRDYEVDVFLKGLTHIFMCENPLNFRILSKSRELGIKSFVQVNFEFCDNYANPAFPEPDYFIMPSYWKIPEMKERYGEERVIYLPPPLSMQEFSSTRDVNLKRSGERKKFLHIVGTLAAYDRNGTIDLLKSLQHIDADFSLTIRSQQPLPDEYMTHDYRVAYKIGSDEEPDQIYKDYDALILPRRYAGLCLPVNEALASALPVVMPDISPNNQLLPDEWLVEGYKWERFMARVPIDAYKVNPEELALRIESFVEKDLTEDKLTALEIAHQQFSYNSLEGAYNKLWQ